jgi:hypothetical protein
MKTLWIAIIIVALLFIPKANPMTPDQSYGERGGGSIPEYFADMPKGEVANDGVWILLPPVDCDPNMNIWIIPDNDSGLILQPEEEAVPGVPQG